MATGFTISSRELARLKAKERGNQASGASLDQEESRPAANASPTLKKRKTPHRNPESGRDTRVESMSASADIKPSDLVDPETGAKYDHNQFAEIKEMKPDPDDPQFTAHELLNGFSPADVGMHPSEYDPMSEERRICDEAAGITF